jgi:hypothetical protein
VNGEPILKLPEGGFHNIKGLIWRTSGNASQVSHQPNSDVDIRADEADLAHAVGC